MNFNSIEAGQQIVSAELQELLQSVFLGLPNWKWLSLSLIFIFLYFLRHALIWLTKKLKKAQRYFAPQTFPQFFLDLDFERGFSWVIVCLIAYASIETIGLTTFLETYLKAGIKLTLSINVIRLCYLSAEAVGMSIEEWAKTTETHLDDQLAPFADKTLKVLVVVVGALIILQNFGINVTALLAGLGLGGVALAFAAQDTVANVFGTITILMDHPFKLGDWIKIGDTEGVVEEVGFRSTRVRTFYNSLVTLPNSFVAKEKIDNLSARNGIFRFRHTLGFTYSATPLQIAKFSEELRKKLLNDNSVNKEKISIHFNSFGESSLNVIINFYYKIYENENELMKTNTYLNLIQDVTTDCNLEFAYPTRSLVFQNNLPK